VSIDDDDLLAKRRSAMAQYQQAEAALRNAGVQYTRELWAPQSENINRMPGMGMPGLFDQFFTRNMGSMMGRGEPGMERYSDLYTQGNQIRQAEAALLQARSQIDEIDASLRDARSIAPFDGVITRKVVEEGDTVQPGQPLLVFAQTEYLRIQAEIPARLMAGLERGMFVPARLDVGNVMVQARVSQIYPIADSQRHTVTVKFDLPKGVPGGPGMYAEITIPEVGGKSPTLPVIPMNALVHRGSLPYVFVLGSDNRAILRIVRTGHLVGNDRIAILAGLKAGERVIADPPAGIGSGWSPGDNTSQSHR
jgi:RND family efflux transporter MFP subunit